MSPRAPVDLFGPDHVVDRFACALKYNGESAGALPMRPDVRLQAVRAPHHGTIHRKAAMTGPRAFMDDSMTAPRRLWTARFNLR
jgi:hypothetical protein